LDELAAAGIIVPDDIDMELFANITGMGSTKARSGKEMEAIRAANFLTNNDPNGGEWIRTNKDPNAAKGAGGRGREGGRRRRG
jgi:5-methyltetrahydrofolate--homocysteine methyltransferase